MRLALALALVVMMQTPATASPVHCTEVGTAQADEIIGGPSRDVICAHRGADYAIGNGGGDLVRGGRGADTLVGGDGADVIQGRAGADDLFAADGHPGDTLAGGGGNDRCYGDDGDTFDETCEHVVRVQP